MGWKGFQIGGRVRLRMGTLGEWDYWVFLRPNVIFGTGGPGPGLGYYENLLEGVEARRRRLPWQREVSRCPSAGRRTVPGSRNWPMRLRP